jgi:hypothetical protein
MVSGSSISALTTQTVQSTQVQSAQSGGGGFLEEFEAVTGQNNAVVNQRMNALDEYTKRYLGLLDRAGIGYEVRRVETPAGGANGAVAFWDYVVTYNDQPAYPGTLLNYHCNVGTDAEQLLQSSISNAQSAQAYSESVGEVEARKVYATAQPETYDYSVTYTTELRDGQLQHALNSNQLNYSDLAAAGYEIPDQAAVESEAQTSEVEEAAYLLSASVRAAACADMTGSQAALEEAQSGTSAAEATQTSSVAAESAANSSTLSSGQTSRVETLPDTVASLTGDTAVDLELEWDPSTAVDSAGASEGTTVESAASLASRTMGAADHLARRAVQLSSADLALDDAVAAVDAVADGAAGESVIDGSTSAGAFQGSFGSGESDAGDTAGGQAGNQGGSALGTVAGLRWDSTASSTRSEAAGRPAEGAASSAGTLEPNDADSQTVQDVRFRINGARDTKVDVSVSTRGNDVRVVVRTPDVELTRNLRDGVSDLVQRLEASGYKPTGIQSTESGSSLLDPSNQAKQGEDGLPGQRQNRQDREPAWDQDGSQASGQSEDALPQWLEEMTASIPLQPAIDRREQL